VCERERESKKERLKERERKKEEGTRHPDRDTPTGLSTADER